VTIDHPIFVVEETGERTFVRFLEWRSSFEAFYELSPDAFTSEIRDQLESLIDEHQCAVLAIDMSSVEPLPSLFLGLLIALSKSGVQIELLHPSPIVRESLEISKLDQFFTIQD